MKKGDRLLFKLFLRVFLLFLFLVSAQRAWGGFAEYRAEQNFSNGRIEQAMRWARNAESSRDPQMLLLGGTLFYQAGQTRKDPPSLEKSARSFEKLRRLLPFYGRAAVGEGLARLEIEKYSPDGLTRAEWEKIKALLLEGLKKEPESAWIFHAVGTRFLSHPEFLSEAEKEEALQLLKKSIGIEPRHPDSPLLDTPSPYLKKSLQFLFSQSTPWETLKTLVPEDPVSYQIFLQFTEEAGLWSRRAEVEKKLWQLQKSSYERLTADGRKKLDQGNYKRAKILFRKAYWVRSRAYSEAKAGILAAEQAQGKVPDAEHPVFHEAVRNVLQSIIEEKDEDLSFYDSYLKPLFEKFENVPSSQEASVPTAVLPPSAWWSETFKGNRLSGQGQMTAAVHLSSGTAKIRVAVRLNPAPASGGAYLVLKINQKEIGAAFIRSPEWSILEGDFPTRGGKRWLQVEFVKGDSAAQQGIGVELGGISIRQ